VQLADFVVMQRDNNCCNFVYKLNLIVRSSVIDAVYVTPGKRPLKTACVYDDKELLKTTKVQ